MPTLTDRALFQRVDRKLRHQEQMLRKLRSNSRWRSNLGLYYVIDIRSGGIVSKCIDLEEFAKELGVA
jgi:hypothetical protein